MAVVASSVPVTEMGGPFSLLLPANEASSVMRGATYMMDPVSFDARDISLPSFVNSTCSLAALVPSSASFYAAPLVFWALLVAIGSLLPSSRLGRIGVQRSLSELLSGRHSRLEVLDVFRVVAILWVMINHTGSEGRIDILERKPSAELFKKNVHEHPIFGALLGNSALGVEIFLVLSGLLAARSWLRQADEPFYQHYRQFIGRRVFRLAPSIFFFIYLAAGPVMKFLLPRYHSTMISACGFTGILSHLAFLGNWQSTPTCLGYLWYMGLDMQLYVAAPFLLHLLHRRPRLAVAVTAAVVFISAALRAGYCTAYGVCNNSDVDIPFISYPGQDAATLAKIYGGLWEMYGRPYTKCGPFVLGLLFGYFTVRSDKTVISSSVSRAVFCSSLMLCVATIYAILPEYWYPDQGNTLYNTLYTAFFRTVFAVGTIGMIFGLVYRQNGISVSRWWSILAKLTFNAYLLHMPIIYIFNFLPFLQAATGALELMAVIPFVAAASFTAAALFYVLVESPMGNLSSILAAKTL